MTTVFYLIFAGFMSSAGNPAALSVHKTEESCQKAKAAIVKARYDRLENKFLCLEGVK